MDNEKDFSVEIVKCKSNCYDAVKASKVLEYLYINFKITYSFIHNHLAHQEKSEHIIDSFDAKHS